MSSTEPTPWYDTRIAKGITYLLGAIGVVAVVAPLFTTPRTSLIATYRQVPFIIPAKLQRNGAADSVSASTNKLVNQLYQMLRTRSTDKEQKVLDSIPISELVSAPPAARPVESFASRYDKLCVLHLVNEGDKSLNPIQILPGKHIHYEYLDSSGKLQQGESQGKFSIGELAPTEEKDVYLWNNGLLDFDNLTLAYPDGKVQAKKPVEVTGSTAWLVEHSFGIMWGLLLALFFGVPYFIAKQQRRRMNEIIAVQQEAEEAARQQVAEQAEQVNKMLGLNNQSKQ